MLPPQPAPQLVALGGLVCQPPAGAAAVQAEALRIVEGAALLGRGHVGGDVADRGGLVAGEVQLGHRAGQVVVVVRLAEELAEHLAVGAASGLGRAGMDRCEPVVVLPGALQVVGVGLYRGSAVDQVIDRQAVAKRGLGDHAAIDRQVGQRVQRVPGVAVEGEHGVRDVVVLGLDVERVELEVQLLVRLELQGQRQRVAVARLVEVVRADRVGGDRVRVGQQGGGAGADATRRHGGRWVLRPVGGGGGDGVGRAAAAIDVVLAGHGAVGLDAVAADLFFRTLGRQQEAESAGVVLPAGQARDRRLAAADAVVVEIAHGAAQRQALEVQRLAGDDVHRAADRTFVQTRFRRLVDLDLADQLRCQQRVVEGAALLLGHEPVARGDGLAVQQRAVERRVGAQDGDLLALAEGLVYGHAGDDGDGLGHIGGRELAHVLGGHDVDDGVGIALAVQGLLQAGADAGDHDGLQLAGVSRLGLRRCLGLCRGGQARGQQRGGCGSCKDGLSVHRLLLSHGLSPGGQHPSGCSRGTPNIWLAFL